MDESDGLILIVITFIALIILSRIVNFVLGTYYMKPGIECEFWTFIIIFIVDSIVMYGLVKFGYGQGFAEAFKLIFMKALSFIIFYFLILVLIEYLVSQNFLNFIH